MKAPRTAGIVVMLFAVLALTGCDYSGGGWAGGTSARNAKQSFAMSCLMNTNRGNDGGRGSFTDRDANVSFSATSTNCGGSGTYRPTDRSLTGGSILITNFTDTGAVGPSKGDHLAFVLSGGSYDGYSFNADLDGGNLTSLTR